MTFKEQLAVDNKQVFMNAEEFAEMHTVNGNVMPCQIDNFELIDRERRYKFHKSEYSEGVYLKQILMFVNSVDFGALPAIGRLVTIDKKSYTVADAINEGGLYSLTLEQNKT